MKNKKMKKVLKVAKNLIKEHMSTTTLGIKNELRRLFPDSKWFQSDISDAMYEACKEQSIKGLEFSDTGVHRVYTRSKNKVDSDDTTILKTPTTIHGHMHSVSLVNFNSATSQPQQKSRTDIVELMKNSGGKFFTVIFTKKDGSERVMNGQVKKKDFFDNLGYIKFKEANGNDRKVNPQTIKAISISKQLYIVK